VSEEASTSHFGKNLLAFTGPFDLGNDNQDERVGCQGHVVPSDIPERG